ncbi:SRPBCC family protein [Kutzneria sp. NPDC052558]|uniref:SRPBCC family protein n=1 Tax=Kutzneria sp. NPDC052558 TaxID=3364121 RepID=UPI0037C7F885
MSPRPTGRLFDRDLTLTRTYRAPIDDVWASVTEPERTARWFGRWEGEGGTGRTIKVQMAFEENAPWTELRIDACEPPRRLAVSASDEHGGWKLELLLAQTGDTTELTFVHHLDSLDNLGGIGSGWEYYLDMLTAAREGTPQPDFFKDYFPAMEAYYAALVGKA